MEVCSVKGRSDRISIVYRDPVTKSRMKTPDGSVFRRLRLLDPEYDDKGKLIKYRTRKNGGIHLYFPDSVKKGNVIDYLKSHPTAPVYITEGEKKAARVPQLN